MCGSHVALLGPTAHQTTAGPNAVAGPTEGLRLQRRGSAARQGAHRAGPLPTVPWPAFSAQLAPRGWLGVGRDRAHLPIPSRASVTCQLAGCPWRDPPPGWEQMAAGCGCELEAEGGERRGRARGSHAGTGSRSAHTRPEGTADRDLKPPGGSRGRLLPGPCLLNGHLHAVFRGGPLTRLCATCFTKEQGHVQRG